MANEPSTQNGGWNSLNQSQNNVIFVIYVMAAVLHCLLWLQLFIHKTKFDLTFLFSLGYMSTDTFLFSFYFIQYSIRIRSWIPVTPLSCYFEAYSMLYFNLIESYCLTALSISRYGQIVRNQNIFIVHRRKVIISSVIVLCLILINFIIQGIFGWCVVIEDIGSSCTLSYTNIIVRVWNITIILISPILINLFMVMKALYYLQNTNAHQMFIRRNHHRRLMIHSSIFYFIWLSLWSPSMFFTYLDTENINESIQFIASIGNTLETLVDPFIFILLDKRFGQAYKKSFIWIKHRFHFHVNAIVHPVLEMENVRHINNLAHTHS